MKSAKGGLREVRMEAVVLGPCLVCGVGAEFHGDDHQFSPSFTRDLGVVSKWHKNPLVRLVWRCKFNLKLR